MNVNSEKKVYKLQIVSMKSNQIYTFTLFLTSLVKLLHATPDQTLVDNAQGCEVAKESFQRLMASQLFSKGDNFLLARVARMTDFGQQSWRSNAAGIWQTTGPFFFLSKLIFDFFFDRFFLFTDEVKCTG